MSRFPRSYGWPVSTPFNPESTDSSGPNGLTPTCVLSRMPYDPWFARHPVNGSSALKRLDTSRRQGFRCTRPDLNQIHHDYEQAQGLRF